VGVLSKYWRDSILTNKPLHSRSGLLHRFNKGFDFLESPVGVEFLHNLTLSLHFEFTKVGCASLRNICNFLELTKLSRFVAPSYGTHQKISDQMDIMIGKFGDMEEARLSIMMEGKRVAIIEDETFHPQICLVAIEPGFNYIIFAKYAKCAKDRSGATRNEALTGGSWQYSRQDHTGYK
jgi:hypothetical protein